MRTYLITGCSSGLGYETTLKLLKDGHTVIPITRDVVSCMKFSTLPNCFPILEDITNTRQLSVKLEDTLSKLGRTIDVLIFNASPNLSSYKIKDTFVSELQDTLDALIIGHFKIFKNSALYLSPEAKIVVISSRLGSITNNANGNYKHMSRPVAYKIGKAGLNMLLAIIKDENPNMKCVAIHPGLLNTKMGHPLGNDATHTAKQLIDFIDNFESNNVHFVDLTTGGFISW